MIPFVIFVAGSNTGKTTIIEKVIEGLKKKGYRVAAVKHTDHVVELDKKGTDSWRFAKAGSDMTVIASPDSIGVFHSATSGGSLADIMANIVSKVDIVLVEGFKKEAGPKIEIFRSGLSDSLICKDDPDLVAVAGDVDLKMGVPHLNLDDPDSICQFIEEKFISISCIS